MPGVKRSGWLVAAVVALAPAHASAAPMTRWGCHGPAGQPLGAAGFTPAAGCTASGDGAGVTLAAAGQATLTFAAPAGDVLVERRTAGITGGVTYAGLRDGVVVDRGGASAFATVGPAALQFRLACSSACGPARVEVTRVAVTVEDETPPQSAVAYHSPAAGVLGVGVAATDGGTGLARAEVRVDGLLMAAAGFGGTACTDLSPDDPGGDYPLDAWCPATGSATLAVDTTALADGDHELRVAVFDAAGNAAEPWVRTLTVLNHPLTGSSSATLSVGTAPTGAPGGSAGAVLGAGTSSCRAPQLSMALAQTPLRTRRGVPVLQAGRRYRFRGRLTCMSAGKRRAAPQGARIALLATVRGRTTLRPGGRVGADGVVVARLSARSSRALTFRFTGADGRRAQVRIRILVARR